MGAPAVRHARAVIEPGGDVEAAEWLTRGAGDLGTFHSMLPAVFEAYARVFHPAELHEGARLGDPAPANRSVPPAR